MDAVYPAAASALDRGRRVRRAAPRLRHRTAPVTFAEIKEVDEDKEEAQETEAACRVSVTSVASVASVASAASAAEERRRRPDLLSEGLEERLDREFVAFRRRRARRQPLREPDELVDVSSEAQQSEFAGAQHGAGAASRAASEPRVNTPPA